MFGKMHAPHCEKMNALMEGRELFQRWPSAVAARGLPVVLLPPVFKEMTPEPSRLLAARAVLWKSQVFPVGSAGVLYPIGGIFEQISL